MARAASREHRSRSAGTRVRAHARTHVRTPPRDGHALRARCVRSLAGRARRLTHSKFDADIPWAWRRGHDTKGLGANKLLLQRANITTTGLHSAKAVLIRRRRPAAGPWVA